MLNPLELHRYLKASADKADLRIAYEDTVAPRTDGKTVWLPRVSIFTTKDQAKELMHFVNHEASHIRFSDFSLLGKSGLTAGKSMLGALWNLLEDHRVDYLNGKEYMGDREVGDFSYGINASKAVTNISKQLQESNPDAADILLSAIAFDAHIKKELYPNAEQVRDAAQKLFSPRAKEYYDKLTSGDYGDVLRNIRGTRELEGSEETLELSERLFKEVYKLDPEEEKKQCQKQAEEKEKQRQKDNGKGEEGEGSAGETDKKEVEVDDMQDGKMESGDGGAAYSKKYKIINVDYSKLLPQTHFVDYNEHMNNTGQHLNFKTKREMGDDFQQIPWNEYKVKDYTKKSTANMGSFVFKPNFGLTAGINKLIQGVGFDGFANKVRTKLQIRAKGRMQYGTKSGKLHKASLFRVTMKDAHGFNERVFKKQIKSDVLDTCVQIVVDVSGSMGGHKIMHAAAAASLLNQTIGNVLHVPTEIVAFSSSGVSSMFVIRAFDSTLVATDEIINRFGDASHYMAGNSDGEAILWCYNRIVRRKEKRKVMIVLSDGSPSDGRPGDIHHYTMKVVKEIEKDHRVDIVGIGIMDKNVEIFYKENYVLYTVDEIEPALLKLIDKKLV
jgi:cobalamin biosynthesis protein CobT